MPKDNKRIAYIPNALDFTSGIKNRKQRLETQMQELRDLGVEVELLDLREYFGKQQKLDNYLKSIGGVFINGGNTFILRQAMRISGFDKIITKLKNQNADFLYAGYSAGICILAPDMKSLQIVDNPDDKPYKKLQETIWEGLNFLEYMILPHYDSDHPESEDIDKEVEYCKQNNIPFKTLRDGEVIIIE